LSKLLWTAGISSVHGAAVDDAENASRYGHSLRFNAQKAAGHPAGKTLPCRLFA
jgi:hypothetical protein